MATAVVLGSGSSTSSKNISDEEKRWMVIGICLTKVLTPALRNVLSYEIPKWHQTLIKPPLEIDKQTIAKPVKNLPPSTIKLNYDSINSNNVHKSSKLYDYAVRDPLSLAKLLVKPFMASFTGFDHTMDTSAVLSVMCEAKPFITTGAAVLAKKVRSDVRNEWAHCDFTHWTEANFQTALNDIESLVKNVGLATVEQKTVLDDIDSWRNNGKKLCIGNLMDCELLDLVRTEVGNLQESVMLFNEDSKDKERLLHSLQSFLTSLNKEVCNLRENFDQLKLQHASLNNRYVSTVQDVEKIKNKVAKIASNYDEIPYVFHAPRKNPWFVGRLSEIEDLASMLQFDEGTVIQSKVNIAAVCGLGGVGKTSLATEHAQQKKDYYTGGVYWFSGEDDTAFESSVYDVATRFGIQSDSFAFTFSAILGKISRNRNPWLIVLDNMDELSLSANIVKLLSGPWQHEASGHILITTRRKPTTLASDIRDFDESCCLSLQCFEIEGGKKFLFRRIGIVDEEKDDTIAEKLVHQLGGLPLALEQAAVYIKSLPCTLSQYLELYDSQHLRLLNRQKATPVSVYDSPERIAVRTTWHLNFEHIKETVDDAKAAIRFLYASAFLNPNEIQKDIINVGKPPVEDEEFSECVKTSLGRQQVLKLLTDFSLFSETPNSNLSVHHLVQEVIRDNLNRDPTEKIQSIIDAIRMLHYAFKNCCSPDELILTENMERPSIISGDPSRFYEWHKLCIHSYELVRHLKRVIKQPDCDIAKVFQPETARIVYECAIHLSANSKHDEAKTVANFANDIINLSNQHISASSFFPHIIPLPDLVRRHIHYSCNTPSTSKQEEGKDCVGVPIQSFTPEQLEEIRLRGNDLFRKGCYNEALEMYSDAIDKSKNTASFDVVMLSNRASVYLKVEQYDKALQDAEEYILHRPKCWKGYARKALALVELKDTQGARVAASLAYYYERNIFRDYEPFRVKFGSSLEKCLFVCRCTSDLLKGLLKGKILNALRDHSRINPEDLAVIILENRDYLVSLPTIFKDCILVGTDKCSITFDDNSHVAFVGFFIAYNVNFHSRLTNCFFVPDSVVKLTDCSFESSNDIYTSFCCKGQLKVDSCKFYNCTNGGLLVVGDAEVQNCEFYGNGVALEVRTGGRLLVRKSKMYGNTRQGLLIGPNAKKCIVQDCELYDNKLGGVLVINCESDVLIRGNRIYDNGEPGISVIGKSNISILDNEIFRNSDWGININTFSQAVVKKNKIYNNQDGGICVHVEPSTEKSIIEHNKISCNSGPGIHERRPSTKCKANELHDNKEERNQSTGQSEAKLCYYCKKSKVELKKCTKCFTAQYCGKHCQKDDWNNHKKVCNSLLSDGSIVLNYLEDPIMKAYTPNKRHPFLVQITTQQRAPGLLPVGLQYCPPPNSTSRFIVKMSAGAQDGKQQLEVRLYDRSLTIDGRLTDVDQIGYIVQQYGSMGQLSGSEMSWKKLFMWVKGPENGKLRVFINEFPPYQKW